MRWAIIAGVVGLLAGGAIGRACTRPATEIRWLQHTHWEQREEKHQEARVEQGPVRIRTLWRAAPPRGVGDSCASLAAAATAPNMPEAPPGSLVSSPEGPVLVERIEERGPAISTWRQDERLTSTSDTSTASSVDTIRPGWALGAGVQLAPERALVLQLGRRLVGPFWLELHLAPKLELAPPAAAALLRVEF